MADNINTPFVSSGFLESSASSRRLNKISDAFLKDGSHAGVPVSFELGKYVTQKGFQGIYADILNEYDVKNGVVHVPGGAHNPGQDLDLKTFGGNAGISNYFSALDSAKTVMNKISDMGLDAINTSLTSHRI